MLYEIRYYAFVKRDGNPELGVTIDLALFKNVVPESQLNTVCCLLEQEHRRHAKNLGRPNEPFIWYPPVRLELDYSI